MFVIVVYDIGEKRVNKVLKICRQYLDWVQNSVLEGEMTTASLENMKNKIGKVIDKDEDSVRIYKLRTKNSLKMDLMGVDKKMVYDDGII